MLHTLFCTTYLLYLLYCLLLLFIMNILSGMLCIVNVMLFSVMFAC